MQFGSFSCCNTFLLSSPRTVSVVHFRVHFNQVVQLYIETMIKILDSIIIWNKNQLHVLFQPCWDGVSPKNDIAKKKNNAVQLIEIKEIPPSFFYSHYLKLKSKVSFSSLSLSFSLSLSDTMSRKSSETLKMMGVVTNPISHNSTYPNVHWQKVKDRISKFPEEAVICPMPCPPIQFGKLSLLLSNFINDKKQRDLIDSLVFLRLLLS